MNDTFSTKEKIMSTALKLFCRGGYDGVGIQEIVDSCSITKPTLYYYFGSKAGLLRAILDFYGNRLYDRLSKAGEYNHDFIKHLTDILKVYIEFSLENPDFFYFYNTLEFYAAESEAFKIHSELGYKITEIYCSLFTKSVQEFGNMKGYEILFSKTFQGLISAAANLILKGELQYSEDTVYRIIRSFIYGVAN